MASLNRNRQVKSAASASDELLPSGDATQRIDDGGGVWHSNILPADASPLRETVSNGALSSFRT
jgi:hypothetical protein